MARACMLRPHHFVDLLITAIFTLAPLINTPCHTQPCALQPAHADQDPSLVGLYSPRQIKMTSKATLDSWTAIRRSLGGWLIDPVYFQHCKAFNIRLGEAQLCSCYSNGLQDSYLFRSTVRLFRPLVPGARLSSVSQHMQSHSAKNALQSITKKTCPSSISLPKLQKAQRILQCSAHIFSKNWGKKPAAKVRKRKGWEQTLLVTNAAEINI